MTTDSNTYKHLFGPVPSRRFGRSLGVDLIPFKTCCYDCVFCQLGQTTNLTLNRKEYVPLQEVLNEFDHWLEKSGQADQITLAGSGEPTLYKGFGKIIAHIKARTDIPVAILTNGAVLHNAEVRKSASKADIVKISLSAWNEETFQQINRPCDGLTFDMLVEGEIAFRKEFKNKLFMEVFVIDGINSEPDQIKKIAQIAEKIKPDMVQLNTAVRPPAESFVQPVGKEKLLELAQIFEPEAEIIAAYKAAAGSEIKVNEKEIFEMLLRRPCTARQIADVFAMHLNEVSKYIGKLLADKKIKSIERNKEIYYSAE
jgi:wyosine [tRNA(Phe)-imidazoG37] synthetase (radical SAM superfamily)